MASLAEKRSLLQEYIKAEKAALKNQSYTIKDRTFTRADLAAIQRGRSTLESEIAQMERGGGIRVRRIVPRDG